MDVSTARWAGLCAVPAVVGLLAFVAHPRDAARAESVHEGFADLHPSVLVTNPRVVAGLEEDGFSFGDVLGVRDGARKEDYSEESARVLTRSATYGDLVDAMSRDIADLKAAAPHAGVGPHFEHRLFDVKWLTSERAHYELVGVVNRIDFRSLVAPGCGQTRLVYRLAYRPPDRPQTRLPFTINVIYENRQTDCAELAREWLSVEAGGDVRARLRSGPLAKLKRFDRIETDIQCMRENSTNPTMDDHAEYILRGFNVVGAHLVTDTLRNTPRLDLDSEHKEALRQWVLANVDAIDSGSAEIPTEFLTTLAVSVSPRGLSRVENRPFATLFPDERAAFGDAPLGGEQFVTSPAMLVRRLDEMTCAGCHQSGSVAGFHLLGEARTGQTFNAMTLGISEHLRKTVEWRYRFLQATATGAAPERVPLAEHVDGEGKYGAHCTDDGIWKCAPGFACQRSTVDDDPIGLCMEEGPKRVGDPCQNVQLTAVRGADGDTVTAARAEMCSPRPSSAITLAQRKKCNLNQAGFPGGACTTPCTTEGANIDGAICARIPHRGFESACFKDNSIIEQCLTERGNFALEAVRPCSRTEACRDDYVCARLPNLPLDRGGCVPPYFIFQARVDGPPLDR